MVCPYCPDVELLKTPSLLRPHANRAHPTAKKELLGNAVSYYFVTTPLEYRSVTAPETATDATREAREMLERWASLGGMEAQRILYQAREDWQLIGVAKPKVAPSEDTTSQAAKRTLKAVPVPPKKDLSLLTLNLGSLSTVATVEWYCHGVYQVRLGPGAIRTLARKLEELDGPKEVLPGPANVTVDSQDVLKVLSSILGLKDTKLFHRVTWRPKATIRFLTPERQVEDEDWEAVREVAGEIPTSPGAESGKAGSMWDLPRAEEPQQVPTVEPKTPDAPPVCRPP